MIGSLGNVELVVSFLSKFRRKQSNYLEILSCRCQGKYSTRFPVSDVSAGSITLGRRRYIAPDLQVGRAFCRASCKNNPKRLKRKFVSKSAFFPPARSVWASFNTGPVVYSLLQTLNSNYIHIRRNWKRNKFNAE
jgi:hypothetical protein